MRGLGIMVMSAAVAAAVAAASVDAGQDRRRTQTAPEAFNSPLQAKTEQGAAAAAIHLQIDRYTPEGERKKITDALRANGYAGALAALRAAPAVGHVAIGESQVPLRWAREQTTAKGRAITLVTDAPLYFVGGGAAKAKPRDGFEVAIIQLAVDDYGLGTGTMAAAARFKSDGAGSVVVEDYAEAPIRLTSVHRVIK